ncbi:MAG: DUF6320 domain-containing protein [Lachnospiraceae bacterium]|nr:DUF6320 domain-containing protein [Lachnospiraceae bacterium]
MSYCVNCGVELDKSCSVCPLCNTKVINPNDPGDSISPGPYPSRQGYIDSVQRSDISILMSVILAATALVCGLLNLFVFTGTHWGLHVIAICMILWVFFLPVFFPGKLHFGISLLLDGLSISLYLGIIAWLHPGNGWYLSVALPLTALSVILILIFAFSLKSPRSSILFLAVILFAAVGILTVSIELLVRHYLKDPMMLSWSAVVLTCCVIIDVTLITILRRTRLREAVRRRMHI